LGIIIAKTSREDFGHAHTGRTAAPVGLWTRIMGVLLRWPRRRPSRREKTEVLKDYIADLKEELQDAEERLKDLEK
jgi:hypothetical protein